MQNGFSIRILEDPNGNAVDFSSMTHETTIILSELLNAISCIIANEKDVDLRCSLEKGSIVSNIYAPSRLESKRLKREFDLIVKGKSEEKKKVEGYRKIQDVIVRNGYNYDLNFYIDSKEINVTDIFKEHAKFRTKRQISSGELEIFYLEGMLRGNGGLKPNIHIQSEEKTCIINCSEEQSKSLDGKLYTEKILLSYYNIKQSSKNNQQSNKQINKEEKLFLIDTYTPDLFNYVKSFYTSFLEKESSELRILYIMEEIYELINNRSTDKIIAIAGLFNHKRQERIYKEALLLDLVKYVNIIDANEKLKAIVNSIQKSVHHKIK